MSARRREVDIGLARGRRLVVDLCRELDSARVSAGLSYAEVGRAVGVSGDQVGRICRGESRHVSVLRLAALLTTVGLDLSARAFPGGLPIRDAAHLALLNRLKARLAPALRWRLEVPIHASRTEAGTLPDRRAWDAVIQGNNWTIGVEAETRLGDVQALLRRIALKRRDGAVDQVILLVSETVHNRSVLAIGGLDSGSLFGGSPRGALRSLGSGDKPRADSLIVL